MPNFDRRDYPLRATKITGITVFANMHMDKYLEKGYTNMNFEIVVLNVLLEILV